MCSEGLASTEWEWRVRSSVRYGVSIRISVVDVISLPVYRGSKCIVPPPPPSANPIVHGTVTHSLLLKAVVGLDDCDVFLFNSNLVETIVTSWLSPSSLPSGNGPSWMAFACWGGAPSRYWLGYIVCIRCQWQPIGSHLLLVVRVTGIEWSSADLPAVVYSTAQSQSEFAVTSLSTVNCYHAKL